MTDTQTSTTPKHRRSAHHAFTAQRRATRLALTVAGVNQAVVQNRGLLDDAASELGVSRNVLKNYIRDRPSCAAVLKEARDAMGDVAERKLFELIEAGDVKCILFYLATVHKDRGYGVKNGALFENNTVHVGSIQIVSIPSGQFLPPEEKPLDGIEYTETPPDEQIPDFLK